MNYQDLKAEIDADPLARGYSSMTDLQVITSLNTADRSRNKTSLSGSQIINAVDKTEFTGLTDVQEAQFWNIVHLGDINPFGIEKDIMVDIFGGGSTTIATLSALRVEAITRAQELGLGSVNEGDVNQARSI